MAVNGGRDAHMTVEGQHTADRPAGPATSGDDGASAGAAVRSHRRAFLQGAAASATAAVAAPVTAVAPVFAAAPGRSKTGINGAGGAGVGGGVLVRSKSFAVVSLKQQKNEKPNIQHQRQQNLQQHYKFVETVRGREKRAALEGYDCDCCRGFYEALEQNPTSLLHKILKEAEAAVAGGAGGAVAAAQPPGGTTSRASSSLFPALVPLPPPAPPAPRQQQDTKHQKQQNDDAHPGGGISKAKAAGGLGGRGGGGGQGNKNGGSNKGGSNKGGSSGGYVSSKMLTMAGSRHRRVAAPDHTPAGYWHLEEDGELPSAEEY